MVTPSVLASSTMTTVTTMLDLLGFEYAKHKLKPFEIKADVLGVTVDYGRSSQDRVLIGNKMGRVDEVRASIDKVLP